MNESKAEDYMSMGLIFSSPRFYLVCFMFRFYLCLGLPVIPTLPSAWDQVLSLKFL